MNHVVVFTGPGQVTIQEKPLPTPRENELLIETECSLISVGTETTLLRGNHPVGSIWAQLTKYPMDAGYSNVGRVIATGTGCSSGWIGKRVASKKPHAAYVCSPEGETYLVEKQITSEESSFFVLAWTSLNGLRRAGIQLGEKVVVFGLGVVGQLTARLCHLAGCRPVLGIEIESERIERYPKQPGFIAINSSRENAFGRVMETTNGQLADVVFETTGNEQVIPHELKLLRRQGRLVILSSPRGLSCIDFHDQCNRDSLTIIGAHADSHPTSDSADNPWTRRKHANLFFDLVASGDIRVDELITHRIPWNQAPEVYRQILRSQIACLAIILEWKKPGA